MDERLARDLNLPNAWYSQFKCRFPEYQYKSPDVSADTVVRAVRTPPIRVG